MADDRVEQEPIAAAVFEVTQGGALEGRLRARLEEMRDVRLGVAAVPAQRLSKGDLWLIDTGCGRDL
eukprot:1430035-Alexandrium_andersonii.AAC.1